MRREERLTEAEVHILVRAFEDKWQLFSRRVDGICIWQLIRFELSVRKQRGGLARAALTRRRLVNGTVTGLLQYLWPSRKYNYLCKTFDSAHRGQDADGTVDIYFDDLCNYVAGGAKISSCDTSGFEDKISRASHRPVFDDTSIIVLSALLGRFLPFRKSHAVFGEIANAIAGEFGFTDYTAAKLARTYNVFRWRSLLYKRLLAKYSPSVVLSPDSGQFALMKACAEMGTPFVEMQHGVFTSVHPNALPVTLRNETGILKPDALAVYGAFTRDMLTNTLLHVEGRIFPVGGPSIERARRLRDTSFTAADKVVIAVTAQGIETAKMCEFLAAFLQKVGNEVVVKLKLHPAYDVEEDSFRVRLGGDPRIEIISGKSTISTHELIALSDLHLSISSAAHYDSLGMGTPTGVIALETHHSVDAILHYEGAFIVTDADQLALTVARRDWPRVPDETRNLFFVSGFNMNMARLMQLYATKNNKLSSDSEA
ncbi:MAG: hypothetical protein ACYC10_09425 [Allorhizobium sp.]